MPGTLTIPNSIGGQPGPDILGSLFDQNWQAIATYVNVRQITQGLLAARPTPGVLAPDGTYFFATDQNGGTLFGSTGSAWTQLAPGVTQPVLIPGALSVVNALAGDQSGSYSTTSATYVDVDAVNLKTTIAVPIGSKFILVWAFWSLTTGTAVVSGQDCVRIFAAGQALGPYSFCGGILPTTVQSVMAVAHNPTSGAQTVALQFRGDGVNAAVMSNPTAEGYASNDVPVVVPRMLVAVTT